MKTEEPNIEPVHKLRYFLKTWRVWCRMFEIDIFEVLKIKEFTFVNDCFQDKKREEVGHYGQTLI